MGERWATTDTFHAAYLILSGARLIEVVCIGTNRGRFILDISKEEAQRMLCQLFGSDIQRCEQLRRQLTGMVKEAQANK